MIVIVDACGANFSSVRYAIERLWATESEEMEGVGKEIVQTSDPLIIQAASHVILPGVGTAAHVMQALRRLQLTDVLPRLTQPVLGICLGMQILYEHSDEGNVDCLGIFPGDVTLLEKRSGFNIPHMGWNRVTLMSDRVSRSSLLDGLDINKDGDRDRNSAKHSKDHFYFVHSYAAPVNDYTVSVTDYTRPFAASVQKGNFYGTQFHPERSGKMGMQVLRNFLEL